MDDRALDRFLDKLVCLDDEDGGCWQWLGTFTTNGYGQFFIAGSRKMAHRLAYEHFEGEIPEGFHVDHLCRNQLCVNPAHLEPVTPAENSRRGLNGIPKTPENTARYVNHPFRRCRVCQRNSSRVTYERRRAAS